MKAVETQKNFIKLTSAPGRLLLPMSAMAMQIHAWIWPNRACNPEKLDIIERAFPFVSHLWSGQRASCWNLEACGIHPDYQSKGAGKMLVQKGLEWAREEGVCASVTVAPGMDGFYQRCGFQHQDGRYGMGEGNPLAGGKGGNIWWWYP